MHKPDWKSIVLAGTMALTSQTSLAKSPLPCPTDSPLVDTAAIIQGDTRAKIENRLRSVDTEKHHQVVVVTVDNIEEYGYSSIRDMGLAYVGQTGCKIGYSGSNTGVLVLFSKTPAPIEKQRYGIEVGRGVEGYVTDTHTGRIGRMSVEKCGKDNPSCRLDVISDELVKLINAEMAPKGAVEQSKMETQTYNDNKSSIESSQFWNMLGASVVILVGTGGIGYGGYQGVHALRRGGRRRALKKEILDLFVRTNAEVQKYPEWFQNEYCRHVVNAANEMQSYTDEKIDNILDNSRDNRGYAKNKDFIESGINEWVDAHNRILDQTAHAQERYDTALTELNSLKNALVNEGYKFQEVETPKLQGSQNPIEMVSKVENVLTTLNRSIGTLQSIRGVYETMAGTDEQVLSNFSEQKQVHISLADKYNEIFGTTPGFDLTGTERQVNDFVDRFRGAYSSKDMPTLTALLPKKDTLLRPLAEATRETTSAICAYEEIPAQIASREKQLASVKMKDEYKGNAAKYARKTGRSNWSDYDLMGSVAGLRQILARISESHKTKRGLAEVPRAFREFDAVFTRTEEYMGLGVALATIIANEVAEVQRAEQRRRDNERRVREEAAEAERSRKRREQDDEDRRRRQRDDDDSSSRRSSSSNSSSDSGSSSWSSGGGSDYSGGGGSFD